MEGMADFLKGMKPEGESFQTVRERLSEMNGYRLFMNKYPDIDSYTIYTNQTRLLQMSKEFSNCGVCMSFDSCKNSFHGHCYGLNVTHNEKDGWQITEMMKPCRKFGKRQ